MPPFSVSEQIMHPEGFLSWVLPETGPYIIGYLANGKFKHVVAHTTEQAHTSAAVLDSQRKDVYFALGTITDSSTLRGIRKQSNIARLKCFWLDLDVAADNPKKYPTQRDAILALKEFCSALAVPMPLIVSSGYGIHAYWVLSQSIPTNLWVFLATRLKALTTAHSLLADPARTADCASVLRIAGTHNYKNGVASEVKILSPTIPQAIDVKVFLRSVVSAAQTVEVPRAHTTAVGNDTGLGEFDVPQQPAKLGLILPRCQQIREFCKARGNVSEPVWYAAIQLLRYTQEGTRAVHTFSTGHPEYSENATNSKLAQLEDIGPTLCERFHSLAQEVCPKCQYWQKIKTPLVLGRLPDDTPAETTPDIPCDPKFPFKRTAEGRVIMQQLDPQGAPLDPVVVLNTDIYPIRRYWEDRVEYISWRACTPKEGWNQLDIPANHLYDAKLLMTVLSNAGIYPDIARIKEVQVFLQGYAQQLQATLVRESTYTQFGFTNSGFVLGNTYMEAGKPPQTAKLGEAAERIAADNFGTAGTLEAWQSVSEIYNRPGMEEYAFAYMVGFGALFMRYSEYSGAVYNLLGKSGIGKSTLLRLIHSIYGQPKESALLQDDTVNASAVVLSCYNHIPITYDEITNISPDKLSELTYRVTNGRDKRSLTTTRKLRTADSEWRLPMFCTSNRSLFQILHARGANQDGETRRIMERRIDSSPITSLTEARRLFAPLRNNYGHAGKILIMWMLEHQAEAEKLYKNAEKLLMEQCSSVPSERFWVMFCALAVCGAAVGKHLGLHEYNVAAIRKYAAHILISMRSAHDMYDTTASDTLGNYLAESVRNMVVINEKGIALAIPNGELAIRADHSTGKLYISKRALNLYCAEIRVDIQNLLNELRMQNILLADSSKCKLGQNTSIDVGMVPCYVFDLTNAHISGKPSLATAPTIGAQHVAK